MPEGFFGRWSRRKQEAREEEQQALEAAPSVSPAPPAEAALPAAAPPAAAAVDAPPAADAPPPPTLADAAALTPESDFRPFVANNVAPEVKNLAFRKLFADPQFNVMDGLDIYVDDYSRPTPIPDGVLRQMASAKFLKLFDDEEERGDDGKKEEKDMAPAAGDNPESLAETPHGAAPPDVAQSEPPAGDSPSQQAADAQPASQSTDDHHADLRLQPDDAARAEDARRRAG